MGQQVRPPPPSIEPALIDHAGSECTPDGVHSGHVTPSRPQIGANEDPDEDSDAAWLAGWGNQCFRAMEQVIAREATGMKVVPHASWKIRCYHKSDHLVQASAILVWEPYDKPNANGKITSRYYLSVPSAQIGGGLESVEDPFKVKSFRNPGFREGTPVWKWVERELRERGWR